MAAVVVATVVFLVVVTVVFVAVVVPTAVAVAIVLVLVLVAGSGCWCLCSYDLKMQSTGEGVAGGALPEQAEASLEGLRTGPGNVQPMCHGMVEPMSSSGSFSYLQ